MMMLSCASPQPPPARPSTPSAVVAPPPPRCDFTAEAPRYANLEVALVIGPQSHRHALSVPVGFVPVSVPTPQDGQASEAVLPREPFVGGFVLHGGADVPADPEQPRGHVLVHTVDDAPEINALGRSLESALRERTFIIEREGIERLGEQEAARFDIALPADDASRSRCGRVYAVRYDDHLLTVGCSWMADSNDGPAVLGACAEAAASPRLDDSRADARRPDDQAPESVRLGRRLEPLRIELPTGIVPLALAEPPTDDRVAIAFTDVDQLADPVAVIHVEMRRGAALAYPTNESERASFASAMGETARLAFEIQPSDQSRPTVVLEGEEGDLRHRWTFIWRGEETVIARCRYRPADDRVAAGCASMLRAP